LIQPWLATIAAPLSKLLPPRTASRRYGLNEPTPVPLRLNIEACTKRAPLATAPKFQPSPSICTARPVAAWALACAAITTSRGSIPMMS
jgi:hypothetical protein